MSDKKDEGTGTRSMVNIQELVSKRSANSDAPTSWADQEEDVDQQPQQAKKSAWGSVPEVKPEKIELAPVQWPGEKDASNAPSGDIRQRGGDGTYSAPRGGDRGGYGGDRYGGDRGGYGGDRGGYGGDRGGDRYGGDRGGYGDRGGDRYGDRGGYGGDRGGYGGDRGGDRYGDRGGYGGDRGGYGGDRGGDRYGDRGGDRGGFGGDRGGYGGGYDNYDTYNDRYAQPRRGGYGYGRH